MKALRFAVLGVVALVASLAVACSEDDGDASVPTGAGGGDSVSSGGLVRPNTFLTYEGKRYELIHIVQADMVDESEFSEAGQVTEADIDLKGDLRVFERSGDAEAVWTFSEATSDDVALWLRWRLAS